MSSDQLQIPAELGEHARAVWVRHHQGLIDSGKLPGCHELFIALCISWEGFVANKSDASLARFERLSKRLGIESRGSVHAAVPEALLSEDRESSPTLEKPTVGANASTAPPPLETQGPLIDAVYLGLIELIRGQRFSVSETGVCSFEPVGSVCLEEIDARLRHAFVTSVRARETLAKPENQWDFWRELTVGELLDLAPQLEKSPQVKMDFASSSARIQVSEVGS